MEQQITHTIISNTYTDEEGYTDVYGYSVYDSHPLAKLSDDGLFLGEYEIKDYDWILFKSKIPQFYVCRKFNGDYNGYLCGFDLIPDGRAWISITNSYYDTIEEAMQVVKKRHGEDCFLCIEEEMHI